MAETHKNINAVFYNSTVIFSFQNENALSELIYRFCSHLALTLGDKSRETVQRKGVGHRISLKRIPIRTRFAVRRQDENSLLALHSLTTGHAFDWTRASVVGNGTTKRTREFTEAWKIYLSIY